MRNWLVWSNTCSCSRPALASSSRSNTVHTRQCPHYGLIFKDNTKKLLYCRDLRRVANEKTLLSLASLLMHHMTTLWQNMTLWCSDVACHQWVNKAVALSLIQEDRGNVLKECCGNEWRNLHFSCRMLCWSTHSHKPAKDSTIKTCLSWSLHLIQYALLVCKASMCCSFLAWGSWLWREEVKFFHQQNDREVIEPD